MKDFNEKCAEYLGWEYHSGYWINPNIVDPTQMKRTDELGFNTDWKWIMIVIEAILEECSEDGDLEPYSVILDSIPYIEAVKQEIYNYITNNEQTI